MAAGVRSTKFFGWRKKLDPRWVEYEERAAILEFDHGLTERDAEAIARREIYSVGAGIHNSPGGR